jgi:hypothetical protein
MIAKSQFSAMTVLQLVLGEDGFVIGLPGRKQVEDDPSELEAAAVIALGVPNLARMRR